MCGSVANGTTGSRGSSRKVSIDDSAVPNSDARHAPLPAVVPPAPAVVVAASGVAVTVPQPPHLTEPAPRQSPEEAIVKQQSSKWRSLGVWAVVCVCVCRLNISLNGGNSTGTSVGRMLWSSAATPSPPPTAAQTLNASQSVAAQASVAVPAIAEPAVAASLMPGEIEISLCATLVRAQV